MDDRYQELQFEVIDRAMSLLHVENSLITRCHELIKASKTLAEYEKMKKNIDNCNKTIMECNAQLHEQKEKVFNLEISEEERDKEYGKVVNAMRDLKQVKKEVKTYEERMHQLIEEFEMMARKVNYPAPAHQELINVQD